jgi:hypothetical protein
VFVPTTQVVDDPVKVCFPFVLEFVRCCPLSFFLPSFNSLVTFSQGKVTADGGHSVEWVSEENYKFKLSEFQEPLKQWLKKNPQAVFPVTRSASLLPPPFLLPYAHPALLLFRLLDITM